MQFRLFLEGKTGKKYLSHERRLYSMLKTTPQSYLNRGSITDLPLMRILLAIYQKPSFMEEIVSFVSV